MSNKLKVKNPVYDKGELKAIEDLKPFSKKDAEGIPIKPTLADANKEKRKIYSDFLISFLKSSSGSMYRDQAAPPRVPAAATRVSRSALVSRRMAATSSKI